MAESISLEKGISIVWKVKNLFSVQRMESPPFKFNGLQWTLKLQNIYEGVSDISVYGVSLDAIDSKTPDVENIRINMYMEDKNQRPQFNNGFSKWIPRQRFWFAHTSSLRKEENLLLINGVATFVCLLVPERTSGDATEREEGLERVSLENLSLDLHHLLDGTFPSDVTLICGDHSIPVHKNILCARSKVFSTMLQSDMAESRSGIIEINDMEVSTLNQLVQYIYSGKVSDMSVDGAQQIYAAADLYDIDSLKSVCRSFMKENLTEENACNILVFSDVYNDKNLKDYALSFIVHTDLLLNEEHWLKFQESNLKLAAEVVYHVYKAKHSPK